MKKRAVAADSFEGVLRLGEQLRLDGHPVTYDQMLEGLSKFQEVNHAFRDLLGFLFSMSAENCGNIAIKPTMLGLGLRDRSPKEAEKIFENLLTSLLIRVSKKFSSGVDIEIDAEDASTVRSTYHVVSLIRAKHPELAHRLRVAVQMHLPEIPILDNEYLLLEHPVRLVKGSGVYKQDSTRHRLPDHLILPRMMECFRVAVSNGTRPFIATAEDKEGTEEILRFARDLGVSKNAFEIQMLLGFGTKLAKRWSDAGYTVRVYCPFLPAHWGDRWIPYVERRFPMVWKNKIRSVKRFSARLFSLKYARIVPPK